MLIAGDWRFLDQLDEKVRLERNNQRIQEIQQHLTWPSITDIDLKVYIPEVETYIILS